jgi:hypothetical protein
MNMLRAADMPEKHSHGQLVDRVAAVEAMPACNPLTAKAVEDKTISRHDFLSLGMALAGVAAFGGFAATLPKCAVADTTTFPGIRWHPVMGVYKGAEQGWTSNRTLLQDQYNFWVGASRENRYLDLGNGDAERYWFAGGQKISWRDCLVDENLAPTSHTEARNPDWSNYRWNRQDIFTEMLAGSSAASQDKAKLGLFVAVTATSQPNPVPTWLLRDSRKLTWTDGQGKDHVRLDKDEGWRAVADFLVAMTRHYGLDQRIASLTIGEYYTNPDGGGIPADLDYDVFRVNAKKVWSDVTQNAPKDASGARMNIVQSMPIVSDGFVTVNDIANIGIGVSGSVGRIFADRLDGVRQQLYGVVPLQHQVNSGTTIGEPVTFDGTPNPWGYARGRTVTQRYEHVVWYYGSKGIAPLESMYLGAFESFRDQWIQAYDQFGPNGNLVAQWGQLPNYP